MERSAWDEMSHLVADGEVLAMALQTLRRRRLRTPEAHEHAMKAEKAIEAALEANWKAIEAAGG